MKYQESKVAQEPEIVHLLFDGLGWVEYNGHILTMFGYHFSLVPLDMDDDSTVIRVSDMLSGGRVFDHLVPDPDAIETKQQFIRYCENVVGKQLRQIIGSIPVTEFDRSLKVAYM
ncbi:hypothetical protein, partial [Klebsiella pneumoniae]|uniref:hypothetical protein n=1 Tax=Klebsiella pneumoniae TaxID=573 RepID=UPI000EBBC370